MEKMNKKQAATIKEVAALAEVSQMTVSRVLNDQSVVRESTRKKVQAAIRQLNYRPNIMARHLAGRTGMFIGLIYRNPSYGYLSEFLMGALNTCRELGHYLIVEEPFVDQDMVDLERMEKRFLDTSIQAVIVVPPLSEDPDLIETLIRTGISFVCISPKQDAYTGPSVRMDDRDAAQELTEYLVSLGHQRIGFISGPPDHKSSELRRGGFETAMRAKRRAIDDKIIAQGDYTYVSGMTCAAKMLSLPKPPTAIFASNDDMAAGAIAAAHRAGLRVPEDVSIVGFDNTQNASSIWPPLTTVRQPIREMARAAIEILANKGSPTKQTLNHRTLEHELIIRKSAGPLQKQSAPVSQASEPSVE